MKRARIAKLFLLLSCLSFIHASGSGESRRNPLRDTEKTAGAKLEDDEKEIVAFVFVFYNARYGYPIEEITMEKAADNMSEEEYRNTVNQAAKAAKNPVAKGFIATGKAGEKLLKALIVTIEEGAKSAGEWVEKKSKQYDDKKK